MFTTFLSYLPMLFQAATAVKSILDIANSNESVVQKIKESVPQAVPFLEQVATQLFPKVAPAIHIAAGAMAAFDPNAVKWVQGACNTILGTNLEVDGHYGDKTRTAVEQLQTKLGLKTVDGFAGQITQAAISLALSKLG